MRHFRFAALALCAQTFASAQSTSAIFTGGFEELDDQGRFEGVFDLDQDGDLDAISWWWNACGSSFCQSARLRAYENLGDGRLVTPPGPGVSVHLGSLAFDPIPSRNVRLKTWIGDLDGDLSRAEIVFHWAGYVKIVQLWLERGASSSTHGYQWLQTVYLSPCASGWPVENERSLTVADFDQDGRLDFALSSGYQVVLAFQESSGRQWTEGPTIELVAGGPCPLAGWPQGGRIDIESCDATGDGLPDVVAVRQREVGGQMTRAELTVLPVAGGVFGAPSAVPLDVGAKARLCLGDLDGDGDVDGVIFGMDGYQVWRCSGAGDFTLEPLRSGGPATDLADIDGDGDLDGICCGGLPTPTHTPIFNNGPSQFELCSNDGTGRFDDSVAFPSVGGHHVAGLLDLDCDGDLDLLGGRTVLINHTRAGAGFCHGTATSIGNVARLVASGSTSTARSDLTLSAVGLPPSTFGLFFSGQSERRPGMPLGQGNLCLGGQLWRLQLQQATPSGSIVQFLDLSDPALTGASLVPGDVVRFQLWFRDAGTSNTSGAYRFIVAP